MGDEMGDFLFGVTLALCAMLIVAMMWRGPEILEWIEGAEPR
jgi:hypothetical protein